MDLKSVEHWVSEHPTESIVIGLGGTLAVLWLLGFFSSSSSAGNGSSNLAAAYYAAEAQQAVVGGQIQMATIQTAGATAMNAANTNAAVAINKAQTGAAIKINGQNASAATTINQSNNDATTAQTGIYANDQLLATYSNNGAAIATNASNNAAATSIATTNATASELNNYMGTIMAPELARSGGFGNFTLPGLGAWTVNTGAPTDPNYLESIGWTPNMAYELASLQQGGIKAP